LKYKRWTFTPGLRYENITLERNDFGTEDVTRTGTDLSTRSNEMNEFIPGIGVIISLTKNFPYSVEFTKVFLQLEPQKEKAPSRV